MKTQIRRSVFETNSSSTHSITVCTKSDYEAWKNGEKIFYGSFGYGGGEIMTLEEAKKKSYFRDYNVQTYEDWENYCELETFFDSMTTPNGEEVIAFGAYGYDG